MIQYLNIFGLYFILVFFPTEITIFNKLNKCICTAQVDTEK